jgi:hypothetical protein
MQQYYGPPSTWWWAVQISPTHRLSVAQAADGQAGHHGRYRRLVTAMATTSSAMTHSA